MLKPEYLHQFQPIGLCNVNFKILTKNLVNSVKFLMPKLISINQSRFVPGRQITDNIVVAQEGIHSMRNLRGRKCYIAIIVDLEKAYDCLRRDLIRDTLMDASFPT